MAIFAETADAVFDVIDGGFQTKPTLGLQGPLATSLWLIETGNSRIRRFRGGDFAACPTNLARASRKSGASCRIFRQVRRFVGIPSGPDRGGTQIDRARRGPIEAGSAVFRGSREPLPSEKRRLSRDENSERSAASVPGSNLPLRTFAEATRIAKELVKLYAAGAISGPNDPEAVFYAHLLIRSEGSLSANSQRVFFQVLAL